MKRTAEKILVAGLLGAALLGSSAVFAQSQGSQQPQQQPQQPQQQPQQPAPSPSDKNKAQQPAEQTPEANAPVSAEEDAAIKAFRDAPMSDLAKKDQLGEEFLQKYPQSRYRAEVYSWLVKGYLSAGQVDKMEAAGDKELELNPNDAQTLAILGSTLPRAMNAQTPEPQKRLDKAEQYSKKALDILPTVPKPQNLTDDAFNTAKNQIMAMAYSGLGLVAFRRGKFQEAIPNLEQSAKLDPNPDPVNYYLLGLSNQKASHFEDAMAAYNKCAAMPGGLQASCKTGAEEAKKLALTQMSTPK